jgi:transposase
MRHSPTRTGVQGGRPPFDPVMMFKILIIQATNNLSDERAEFLINDRLSFMRFLGLGLEDRVPDARTIWLFREKLTTAGAIKTLFERFDATLRQAGYIAMSGQIVDASLIAAPRQRNNEDEKKAIKEGRIPEDWKDKPSAPSGSHARRSRSEWLTSSTTLNACCSFEEPRSHEEISPQKRFYSGGGARTNRKSTANADQKTLIACEEAVHRSVQLASKSNTQRVRASPSLISIDVW